MSRACKHEKVIDVDRKQIHRVVLEVDFRPTPREMAYVFWDMTHEEQVEFFNKMGSIMSDANGRLGWRLQAEAISEGELTAEAKYIMFMIGDYVRNDM